MTPPCLAQTASPTVASGWTTLNIPADVSLIVAVVDFAVPF
jgi:hypothetical protein